jgi:hypothetical protein
MGTVCKKSDRKAMMPEQIEHSVVGMLLGDAYIDRQGRFGFNHSSVQEDYFRHKVNLLNTHQYNIKTCVSKIPAHTIEPGRQIKETTLLQAYSPRKYMWKTMRTLWYPNNKKIVPADIEITAQTLAYWYMDDGSANLRAKYISYHGGKKYVYVGEPFIQQFRLYTDGFDETSLEILRQKVSQLGIDCWYHTRKSGAKYLVISRLESRERFKNLILPIVSDVPSMLYKINKRLTFQQERISEKAPDPSQDDALFRSEENNESSEAY